MIVIGAANVPGAYVAFFGAVNTVIGGLLIYFKGRGQPNRARMFREELESCIHQIENSEIMWSGITRNMHGYNEIDINAEVSVRGEIARLTRLYQKALRNNTYNNPDFFLPGNHDDAGGRGAHPVVGASDPAPPPVTNTSSAPAVIPPPADDLDESPATKAVKPDSAPVNKQVDNSKPSDPKPVENGSVVKKNPISTPNLSGSTPSSTTQAPSPTEDVKETVVKDETRDNGADPKTNNGNIS